MNEESILVKILLENKEKILAAKKYDEPAFKSLITSIVNAEKNRLSIVNSIKKIGAINHDKLHKDLGIPVNELVLDIELLKELGALSFIGEKSQFFNDVIEKNDIKGLFPNVSIIRDDLLCCGCGLCVSICPVNAIDYSNDKLSINNDSCIKCGLCFLCCPRSFFPNALDDITQIEISTTKHSEELFYYQDIFTAATKLKELKTHVQDGGIVSSLLIAAFKHNLIDGVLAVGSGDEKLKPAPLFIKSENDIIKIAGTKYSNCHLLNALHDTKTHKNIAIVGTPCMMEALHKISFYPLNKPFYDNISIKIGLFCMESFDYDQVVEFVNREFHKQPHEIRKMDINKGKMFVIDNNNNVIECPLKIIKKYGRYGCFFCEDLTSKFADISIGSIGSEVGWSTVIVRTEKGANLFKKALELNLIEMQKIAEDTPNFQTISRIAKSKEKKYKQLKRPEMPEQQPLVRIKNFDEVQKGLTHEMALFESNRCLQCGRPLCASGCPVNIDIPGFIRLIRNEQYYEASEKILEKNALPAICGRVCPQESQCEGKCLLGKRFKPISIGYLERFVADYSRSFKIDKDIKLIPSNGRKVACIGCGPASLTVAGDLIKLGYEITIYEAFHKGGGVLTYGIPEFRLPKDIVSAEIQNLVSKGVKIKYNVVIGKTLTIDDLWAMGFDAIFIGIGAGLPSFLHLPGENLNGVITANEYLTRANLMKAFKFPVYKTPIFKGKRVIVIGGGNVAMDCARTALRFNSEVTIVYRRAMEQLPARREEVHHAIQEGVVFNLLTNPVSFIGDETNHIKEIECIKMELGPPDKSGRASPVPIKNSEFRIPADLVIIAIGNESNPLLTSTYPEIKLNKYGNIITDEDGRTNINGIFAGGDIVSGSATVISAMGAGKRAAIAIHEYITNKYKQ